MNCLARRKEVFEKMEDNSVLVLFSPAPHPQAESRIPQSKKDKHFLKLKRIVNSPTKRAGFMPANTF